MKKIRVKNEMEEVAVALPMDLGEGSDDDDLGGGDIKMAGVAGEEDDEDSEGSSFVLAFFPLLSSLSVLFIHPPSIFDLLCHIGGTALTDSSLRNSRRRFPSLIRFGQRRIRRGIRRR